MRAAMALLPLFPEHDVAAPATPATPEASSAGIAPPTAATAIAPVSAARAAGLQQLAHLWRADEVAQATCRDATVASGFATLDAELPGGGWPQGQLIELLFDAHGIGELSLLAPALARCTQDARACVWVLPCERATPAALPALPYPPALGAAGIDLSRALFVQPETPREAFWALEQSLRATHLGALVGWLPHAASREEGVEISSRAGQGRAERRTRTEEYGEQRRREIGPRSRKIHTLEGEFRAMRRLQLLASRQQALVFLLRDARARHAPSPAALRLQLAMRDGELNVTILKRRGRPLLEPIALQVHPAHWRHAEAPAPADSAQAAAQPQPAGRLAQAALLVQRWSARAIFSH